MSLISQGMPEKSGVSKLLWTSNHPVFAAFRTLLFDALSLELNKITK